MKNKPEDEEIEKEGIIFKVSFFLLAGYFVLCIIIFHLVTAMFILYLPLYILSAITSCTINNIAIYYFVSLFNVIWIIIVNYYCRKHLDIKEFDVKTYKVVDSSNLWLSAFAAIQIFSDRTILYSIYLLFLILGQFSEFDIIHITNQYILGLIETNQYSIVLLISIDRIINSYQKDKIDFIERINKTIEIFLETKMH